MEGKYFPGPLSQKEYNDLSKTVSLMLRMCRPIFGSGKDVVLETGFFFAKGFSEIEAKDVYESALIKKRRYWPKVVPGDLIDNHFEDKQVGDFGMIEESTEDNKLFKIFCMKEPDFVMKIMVSWMKLDELEGASTGRYFIDSSGTKETKQFTYRQQFWLHLRYIYQVNSHNNQRHAPISLCITWGTRLWPDHNLNGILWCWNLIQLLR